jgi:predicted transcriptional regulator
MKVLLSIKPEYANSILDGTKKYEFRKRVHRDTRVKTIVIYVTKPVGKIVGEFSIKHIHSEHPDQLWERTKEFSGISRRFFSEYFQNKDVGHAIEIKQVKRYGKPKEIGEVLPSGVPPQSFAYVGV